MTNEAAVSLAVSLFKMDTPHMHLCQGERVLTLGLKDLEGLSMLRDAGGVLIPNLKTAEIQQPLKYFIGKLKTS